MKTRMLVFDRVRRYMNLGKTKAMTCNPGFIWGYMVNDAYNWRMVREGGTFLEQKRTRVSCINCGVTML